MNRFVFLCAALLLSATARAEHFLIELTIQAPHEEATAHSDTDPPPQGHNPRPICHAKAGDDLTFQFFVTSNFPHNILKRVNVRYYIAPEKEAGSPRRKQTFDYRGQLPHGL